MSDKAIRAAAKEIERHKMEQWTDTKAVEIARDAMAAYEAAASFIVSVRPRTGTRSTHSCWRMTRR